MMFNFINAPNTRSTFQRLLVQLKRLGMSDDLIGFISPKYFLVYIFLDYSFKLLLPTNTYDISTCVSLLV